MLAIVLALCASLSVGTGDFLAGSQARRTSLWAVIVVSQLTGFRDGVRKNSLPMTQVAAKMNMTAEEVKKDWVSGVLPGIQIVPSGVLAINRAQMHGCTYCWAG